jgi:hypothetical protein
MSDMGEIDARLDSQIKDMLRVKPGGDRFVREVRSKREKDIAEAIAATAKVGHEGGLDVGVVIAAKEAEAAIRWSIEAAVTGVIGNAIYDGARRAIARFLRRRQSSAQESRIEDDEAIDVARFAFAHAGISLFVRNLGDYHPTSLAGSVVRFDGRCIVRFEKEKDQGRVRSNGVEILWERNEVFEALIPERNPDIPGVKYRRYVVNGESPQVPEEDPRMARRILDAWPQIHQTLSDAPGEWRNLSDQ